MRSQSCPKTFDADYSKPEAELRAALAAVWVPYPKKSLVEWAYENINLPSKAGAEPGPLDFSRTPYAVAIAEEIQNSRNKAVVWIAGAQVGKTTLLAAVALMKSVVEKAPVLLAMSTISLAEGFSKERLQPTIKNSPTLSEEFGRSKSKDSENTILYKECKSGGHLVLIGSNSSAELRSRPLKVVLCDEVSSYMPNKDGDVVNLLKQRQVTFFDSTCVLASTPLFKGDRIESEYEATDQRRLFCRCPHCGAEQWLKWAQVRWQENQPQTALYKCESCEELWSEGQRRDAIQHGEFKPTATPKPGYENTPGFHLSALYSPWLSLAQLAAEWLEAQGDRLKLQTFINTKLAEGYQVSEFNDLDPNLLRERAEDYALGSVPMGGLVLTAGVDVQKDRLVFSCYAWGEGEECWLIAHLNLYGNPLLPEEQEGSPWPDLDQLLDADFIHESGSPLKITLTNIDSGYATQVVYKYVLSRERRFRVRAVDGQPGEKPIVNSPSYPQVTGKGKRNKDGLALWGVGVNRAKKTLYSRFNLGTPGPRYIHFPQMVSPDYYQEITGEQIVIKYKNGFPREVWELKPGKENHALDCFVYALAAAYHLRLDSLQYPWRKLRNSLKIEPEEAVETIQAEDPPGDPPQLKPRSIKRPPTNNFTSKPRGSYFGKSKRA